MNCYPYDPIVQLALTGHLLKHQLWFHGPNVSLLYFQCGFSMAEQKAHVFQLKARCLIVPHFSSGRFSVGFSARFSHRRGHNTFRNHLNIWSNKKKNNCQLLRWVIKGHLAGKFFGQWIDILIRRIRHHVYHRIVVIYSGICDVMLCHESWGHEDSEQRVWMFNVQYTCFRGYFLLYFMFSKYDMFVLSWFLRTNHCSFGRLFSGLRG